jgi:hypothetical protein
MDVEKTIEFILDQQAKAEIRWQRSEERWQRAEERTERMEKRQARFETGLDGLRKLVVAGMKMLNKARGETQDLRTSVRELGVNMHEIQMSIRELVAAQKRTDQRFDRLIEILSRRNPNGHR